MFLTQRDARGGRLMGIGPLRSAKPCMEAKNAQPFDNWAI